MCLFISIGQCQLIANNNELFLSVVQFRVYICKFICIARLDNDVCFVCMLGLFTALFAKYCNRFDYRSQPRYQQR